MIIRYLHATRSRRLVYGAGDLDVIGYSDSDWAGDRETRRSNSEIVFMRMDHG